jgi:uncharacterized protein YkwD
MVELKKKSPLKKLINAKFRNLGVGYTNNKQYYFQALQCGKFYQEK